VRPCDEGVHEAGRDEVDDEGGGVHGDLLRVGAIRAEPIISK
jgi:hypothetical protein